MSLLYVLGGRQRKAGLREVRVHNEWYLYEAALILEVDTESGEVWTRVEYQSPREAKAGDRPSAHFHAGTLAGDLLYTCTTTEVIMYRVPEFEQAGYISLPCFNDLHHVNLCSDGNLLVVSTGLDMVIKITPQGHIVNEWSVLDEAPWTRFSRNVDYRQVITTRPHASHPNFVFELDGDIWVTRFYQRDAISLTGARRRIEIAFQVPHDGLARGKQVYFTTVDGKIIVVNQCTLRPDRMIDLRKIQDSGREVLPAWCRGLLFEDDRKLWVGFTRIRKTVLKENVRWVKTALHEGTVTRPTHLALFDIVTEQCLKEIELESHGMNAIYGIYPAPEAARPSASGVPAEGNCGSSEGYQGRPPGDEL
jgi:hypothetical protein